jgi:thymidylate synthase
MSGKHHNLTFNSVDEIQHWVLSSILQQGDEVNPRGMKTLELYPVTFTLLKPRSRCVTTAARRWNLPLAIGEFCWHVAGSNELDFIEYYAPRWREFAEDGATIRGSCYGHRVFSTTNEVSQWERLLQLLRTDCHSRRAILHLSEPNDALDISSKDIACASTIQFLIRGGAVHAVVNMRSNDAIWGLPYDIFLFTMLQELLACELKLNLGTYTHSAASMHLYERHFELAAKLVATQEREGFEMPPMKAHHELRRFLELEAQIRSGISLQDVTESLISLNNYWRDLLTVLDWFGRMKRYGPYATRNGTIPSELPYLTLLQNAFSESRSIRAAHATMS